MLILVPALHSLDLTFPFAAVEGKASSTDKQIFKAEHQAASALAYAHQILYCLDRMENQRTLNPGSYSPSPYKAPFTSSGPTGLLLKLVHAYSSQNFRIVAMRWCRSIR